MSCIKATQIHGKDLRAVDEGNLLGIAMWVVDAHSIDRHCVPLRVKSCSGSRSKTTADRARIRQHLSRTLETEGIAQQGALPSNMASCCLPTFDALIIV